MGFFMNDVVPFRARDEILYDEQSLLLLRQAFGAERFSALCDSTGRMLVEEIGELESALANVDATAVRNAAETVADLAALLCLDAVVYVSRALVSCCETTDEAAMQAVGHRLIRLGETSLTPVLNIACRGWA